jgi:cellulose synthase/poly-beta-1,6-N-acetylglucosamine synthase-like glycosyltransferase
MSPPHTVSAIVPARNEEAVIAACVESLVRQPEIGEIIVVNDQSTDRTGGILRELAGRTPRLRLAETGALPNGWIGKNYAASIGATLVAGDWLLFTDADAVHLSGSTGRALAAAESSGAALVSYSPEQVTETWWEKALIPFVYTRLAQRYPYAEVSDPESAVAAANGQYLLIRRDAYEAIGGHASVAGEVVEDVALAQRVKQFGYKIRFEPGTGLVRVRMYRSFGAMWQGWTKNLFPLLGGSRQIVGRELLSVIPWIPVLLLAAGLRVHVLALLGLLLLAGRHAAYAAVLRHNRAPVSRIFYYVPAVALYGAVLVSSMRRYSSGTIGWKDREYPVGNVR